MRRTATVSLVVAGLGVALGFACTRDGAPAAQGQGAASAAADATLGSARELAPEQVGQQATCPVAGESFTVAAETEAAVYQGRLYLFCCPGCRGRFLADPHQFGAPAPGGG